MSIFLRLAYGLIFFTCCVLTAGCKTVAPQPVVTQPPIAVNAASNLYLAQPEFSLNYTPTTPLTWYAAQPGDIVLSTTNKQWATLKYALAFTWKPTHVGIVVRMNDGQMGLLEAGGGDTNDTHVMPLAERIKRETDAAIWIRRPRVPLSAQQSADLTNFANLVNGLPYAKRRQILQGTIFRTRGPIRTFFIGKPEGIKQDYICSEVVVEALVASGLINPETARPSATFPRDLFYDRSLNLFIHLHPVLGDAWEPPALLVQSPGNCSAIIPYNP